MQSHPGQEQDLEVEKGGGGEGLVEWDIQRHGGSNRECEDRQAKVK